MTKMHFEALAEALGFERPAKHWDANKRTQWELDRKAIMRVCQRFNSAFDSDRFIQATEKGGE